MKAATMKTIRTMRKRGDGAGRPLSDKTRIMDTNQKSVISIFLLLTVSEPFGFPETESLA
jgi:hypothetical protein